MSRLPIDIMLDKLSTDDDGAFALTRERLARIEEASRRTIPEIELEDVDASPSYSKSRLTARPHKDPRVEAIRKKIRLAASGVDSYGSMPAAPLTPGLRATAQTVRVRTGYKGIEALRGALIELEELSKAGELLPIQQTEAFSEAMEMLIRMRDNDQAIDMAKSLHKDFPRLGEAFLNRLDQFETMNVRDFQRARDSLRESIVRGGMPKGKNPLDMLRELPAARPSSAMVKARRAFVEGDNALLAFLRYKEAGSARVSAGAANAFAEKADNLERYGSILRPKGAGGSQKRLLSNRGDDVTALREYGGTEAVDDLETRLRDELSGDLAARNMPAGRGGRGRPPKMTASAIQRSVNFAADDARAADVQAAMGNFRKIVGLDAKKAVAMGMSAEDAKDLALIQRLGKGINFENERDLAKASVALKKAGPAILRFIRAVSPIP